jgi:hypothetical protein
MALINLEEEEIREMTIDHASISFISPFPVNGPTFDAYMRNTIAILDGICTTPFNRSHFMVEFKIRVGSKASELF